MPPIITSPPATKNERLARLLENHFSANDLQQLVALDEGLSVTDLRNTVNYAQSVHQIAFDLIQEAQRKEILLPLVAAAARARPLVPEAREVSALFGAIAGLAIADPARVRVAAAQFNQAFIDRRKLLDRLELYKGLHDILHQILRDNGELKRLVKAAREPGYDPLDAGKTPTTLAVWLKTVDRPGRLPRWVPKFVEATRLIARCVNGEPIPAADAEAKLAELGKLPGDEQGELNERLVEAAENLNVDGLDAPLRDLRNALGPAHGTDLQERFDRFRANCDALRLLTGDHDECQAVDSRITDAVVLMRQPGSVPQWDEMRTRLGRLSPSRPGDDTVGRLIRMVDRLANSGTAAKPDWLSNLQAEFGDFFFDLDARLLDATDELLQTADALDFRLRGYTL